jgi:hypothetical protein
MSDFTKNVIAQNVVHKKCLSCLFRISLNSWSNRVSQNWLFCRQAELLFIVVAGEYISLWRCHVDASTHIPAHGASTAIIDLTLPKNGFNKKHGAR